MTRPELQALRDLVRHHVEAEGLRPFARRLQLPVGVVRSIADGRDVSVSNFAMASERLGMEFYCGPPRIGVSSSDGPTDVRIGESDFSLIRRYEVSISAGPGLVPVAEDHNGALAFTRDWLRQHRINPELAGLLEVKGESMAPRIPNRSLVLVHLGETDVEHGGIYAFSRRGEAFVKRLLPFHRSLDGRLSSMVIISDNPDYPAEIVSGADLNEMRIVGRVRSVLVDI